MQVGSTNTGKSLEENLESSGNFCAQVNRDTSVSAYNDITIFLLNMDFALAWTPKKLYIHCQIALMRFYNGHLQTVLSSGIKW